MKNDEKQVSMYDVLEKKRVKICGLRQNCFVLDSMPVRTVSVTPLKSYISLERKQLPNGYVEELETKDYPVTKDSVNSYVDGADYRRDPASAIANAPKRVNLGDITEVQKFIESDPQHAVRTLRNVVAQLDEYVKTKNTEEKPEVVTTQSTGEGVNNE